MRSSDKKFQGEDYPQPSSMYPSDRGTRNNSATPHANFVNQAGSSNSNTHAVGPTHPQPPAIYPHQGVPTPVQPQRFVTPPQYVPHQNYAGQHWPHPPQTFGAPYQQTGMIYHSSYTASYPTQAVQTPPHQQNFYQHGHMPPIHMPPIQHRTPPIQAQTRNDPIPAPSPGSEVHHSHQSSKVVENNNTHQQHLYQHGHMPPIQQRTPPLHAQTRNDSMPAPSPGSEVHRSHQSPKVIENNNVAPLSGQEIHHHEHKQHDVRPGSTHQNDPDPKRGRQKPVSDTSFQNSETPSPQCTQFSKPPVKKNHEELDRHSSEPRRYHSGDSPERLMEMDNSISKESKPSDIKSSAKSETAGVTFIGNPGSGKSTLLNGIARKVVFPAGISLGAGLTTSISEYVHNGVSLFDTPGLADVERKKQAGQQLDALLSKPTPLRISFVVTLERGRVRPEDAVTIDLVLNAIKDETDDKFGVIINMVSKRLRNEIRIPGIEQKIQRSITGKHSTSHWCYIDLREDLEDKSDERLMHPDLDRFLQRLPETKQKHTRTVPIDTATEDKMESQKELIREMELGIAEELQKRKEASRLKQEKYDEEVAALLQKEQDLSAKLREELVDSASGRACQNRNEAEARPSPGERNQSGLRSKLCRRKDGEGKK